MNPKATKLDNTLTLFLFTMHDIEPFYKWRPYYIASEDKQSNFYGRQYNEFSFTNKVYNYYVHPQWDTIGSATLYAKVLFADYNEGYAVIELIGEWNDCLHNDVMFLKREVVDHMVSKGITKFILACDNVLEFHASDDSYYEEWWDDIKDEDGWIVVLNTRQHMLDEMEGARLQNYINIGNDFEEVNWRKAHPKVLYAEILVMLRRQQKQLH